MAELTRHYYNNIKPSRIMLLHEEAMKSHNGSYERPDSRGNVTSITGPLRTKLLELAKALRLRNAGAATMRRLLKAGAEDGFHGLIKTVESLSESLDSADFVQNEDTPQPQTITVKAIHSETMTTPPALPASKSAILDQLHQAIAALASTDNSDGMSRDEIIQLIEQHAPRPAEKKITVVFPTGKKELGEKLVHDKYDAVLKAVANNVPVMLVGPAGSGKTTLCEQVAEALEMRFYFTGAVASEYKLSGFVDAQGRIVSTAFREAYKNGGLFLFDEVDASMPQAIMAFNAALANGNCDFPGDIEPTKRHENFRVVAAANTYGRGADRQYVGRNQLDAASLDRFAVIEMDYDEDLEKALAGDSQWTKRVQRIRKVIEKQQVRHIVSPRASIMGAKLIAAGFTVDEALNATVWKGLDKDTKARIVTATSGS